MTVVTPGPHTTGNELIGKVYGLFIRPSRKLCSVPIHYALGNIEYQRLFSLISQFYELVMLLHM